MTLIGDFTGGTMSASTVTINSAATVDSVQVNGTDVINGMRAGRVAAGGQAEGVKFTTSFGVTFPVVPYVILQVESGTAFLNNVVLTAITTTDFTAYVYKAGSDATPIVSALYWWAIY